VGEPTSRGTRQLLDQSTARLLLLDLSELVVGQPSDVVLGLGGAGGRANLDRLLRRRIDRLPAAVRGKYEAQLASVSGTLACAVDLDVGGKRSLLRLRLAVVLASGARVELVRHFRPDARGSPSE
jgi:hypothetical protein